MMKLRSLIESVLSEVEGDLYYTPLNEAEAAAPVGGTPNPVAPTGGTTDTAAPTGGTTDAAAPTGKNAEETDVKSVQDFLKLKFNEIDKLWKTHYKNMPPLTLKEITDVAYLAAKNSERSTAKADNYVNIVNTFPILDVASRLKDEVYSKGKKNNAQEAESIFKEWVANVNQKHGTFPLSYEPMLPWSNSVKRDYYTTRGQEADIGDGRIERMNQDLGIYATVATLMEYRRKTWWNNLITRERNIKPGDKQLNMGKFLDDVLVKYAKVETGLPVRDEKIKKAFGDDSTRLFLNVSQAAYQYFRSEVEKVVGKQDVANINVIVNNEKFYASFLSKGSSGGKAMVVNWDSIPGIAEKLKDPEQAQQLADQGIVAKKEYSLKTIKAEASSQNPFAKKLYDALLGVANHVRTKASFDLGKVLDAATATMKGIGLGVI